MDTFFAKLFEAITLVADYLDWVYMLMCFFTSYVVIKYAGTIKLKKRWFVLFTSAALGAVFGIMYWQNGGLPWYIPGVLPYGFSVILSFLTVVFMHEWFGLTNILDKLLGKIKKLFTKK
jgi:hypothetical protein